MQNPTSEKRVKDNLCKELETRGFKTILLISTNLNGIADVIALKRGRVLLIEVKRPGAKARDLQAHRLAELSEFVDVCAVFDGSQDIDELIAGKYNITPMTADPLDLNF